jgi:hypothetical protein
MRRMFELGDQNASVCRSAQQKEAPNDDGHEKLALAQLK